MDGHPKRFQPHLFTLHDEMPWRYYKNLPIEWSHLICKCDRFNYVTNYDNPDKQPPKCGDCGLAPITHFCLCRGCDSFYIKNFSHVNWCNYCDQLCWECCESGTTEACCSANRHNRDASYIKRRPPVGIYNAAKIYTDEELYSVDDFTF